MQVQQRIYLQNYHMQVYIIIMKGKRNFFIWNGLIVDRLPGPSRGGSRPATASKMEPIVIIINVFQSLTIITKCSILDVAAVLDPDLA